jgi:hypothetical protein
MSLILTDAEDVKTGKVRECLIENNIAFGQEFLDDDGRAMRRIPTSVRAAVKDDRSFLAWNLPFKDDAEVSGQTKAEHYTKDGVAAFSTAKGRREFLAKHNDNPRNGTAIAWDR